MSAEEPENGTIVGFDQPVSAVYVRVDEYAAEAGFEPRERWYVADDRVDDDPVRWSDVLEQNPGKHPYRLVREELS